MSAADYTNERWHVDGESVTHDDFPGLRWSFLNESEAEFWNRSSARNVEPHAARAWLAAQPKPVPEVGMRIEATLESGTVVTGEVTSVLDCTHWVMVVVGAGVTCYIDVKKGWEAASDITDWREVTS